MLSIFSEKSLTGVTRSHEDKNRPNRVTVRALQVALCVKVGAVREPPLLLVLLGLGFSRRALVTLIFSHVYSDHQAADTPVQQSSQ